MVEEVKPDRRSARRAETEDRLIAAATELFVAQGYTATTLADVAARAGLAPRTVYLRFATKAELLRRCVGAAVVGDTEPGSLADRHVLAATMTAPTLEDRIRRMAALTAGLMDRSGPLLAVARQAAAVEPEIATAEQAGREDTRRTLSEFWRRADEDGLLPSGVDREWLSETATLLAHADTYLLIVATTAWDIDAYERWLAETWLRLVPAGATALPAD